MTRIRWKGAVGLLAMGFWMGSTPSVGAQVPEIRARVDTTVVTVGDRVTMSIWVDHHQDSRVLWPDSLDLAPFEMVGARFDPEVVQGETARSSLTLSLTVFELGELEIPTFEVSVEAPDGTSVFLETSPIEVRVESVGLDEGGDIRDIKGPLRIPIAVLDLLLPALLLLLGALLAWILYRRFRRRSRGVELSEPALPPRPPHEVALEALSRLEASPLLQRGEVKEYHIRVSEILRSYVEGRFRVPALEMTTRFITAGLGKAGVEAGIVDGFGDFLTRCDMVKFAKHRPGADSAHSVLLLGRELVEKTIPQAPGPTKEASARTGAEAFELVSSPTSEAGEGRDGEGGAS